MIPKPRVFLDTSALFSGIWSDEGGARMILRMGESGAVVILVSPRVLEEIDFTFRTKAPKLLSSLAVTLNIAGVETIQIASTFNDRMIKCKELINHPGDAHILAEAWDSGADFFVTLDRAHFLSVPDLAEKLPFSIGTPGDFLSWYRRKLLKLVE